jgi:hypothetical protein
MTADARVPRRKAELLADATVLLDAIAELGSGSLDPFTDADILARAVEVGLLDAPHLRGNSAGCGKIVTRMVGGACLAVDPATTDPIPESLRVARALGRSASRARACSLRMRRARRGKPISRPLISRGGRDV